MTILDTVIPLESLSDVKSKFNIMNIMLVSAIFIHTIKSLQKNHKICILFHPNFTHTI